MVLATGWGAGLSPSGSPLYHSSLLVSSFGWGGKYSAEPGWKVKRFGLLA